MTRLNEVSDCGTMEAVKVDNDAKEVRVTFADEKQEKQQQRQAQLAALAKKKEQGKLTLEDVDEKLDVTIEILEDLYAAEAGGVSIYRGGDESVGMYSP